MTSYASARTGYRRPPPRPALAWGDLVVAAGLVGLLWLSVFFGQPGRGLSLATSLLRHGGPSAASSSGEVRLRAALKAAHLSGTEERRVRAILAETGESRRAAVAFYQTLHEADAAGATSHASEIDALVEETLRGRLTAALGAARAEEVAAIVRRVYGASGPTSFGVSGP